MKHLPKHLQQRWRYLGVRVEVPPQASIDRGALQRELWYAAQNLLGDPGSAATGMTIVSVEHTAQGLDAIVRVRRGESERARAAVACVDEIDGHEVGVRVRGKSGTVRACEESYLGSALEKRAQRNVVFDGESRPAVGYGAALNVRVDGSYVGATELDLE